MEIMMEKKKKDPGQELRTIKLFCPSLSTIAPFVASLDQCIDIGSIATIFGLEPSTVKLNGHFLSRGLDLVSSVTWNSLLSFFSAKRLPTGGSDDDALVVDGKLSKIGVKRAHCPQEIANGDCCEADEEDANLNGGRLKPESNLVKNKRLKHMNSGSKRIDSPVLKCSPNDYKRKQHMEEVILLKKLKLNETKSGFDELSDAGREINSTANGFPRTAYSCSYNSKNMKRMREDEALVPAFCKRTK
ncbi:uncharacterized protein LOC111460597 isoform X1 [Cucurbita moschata]|uniref:Uncharacterized protein LOC111460597 isoform X1 n=1 Tax=Cucurbita moschata TaxID=3662 RepID=A0A6J1H8F0_CUCMO|nr:uncharacterized protein LOC111460597 isoform X1 [Cucurbita moschata]